MKKAFSISILICILTSTWQINILSLDKPTNNQHYDVVIVGGGIAGLTAAWFLTEDGKNIKVVEKNDYAGGRCFSGNYNGFTYAKGTEYLGEPEWPLKKIIKKLGIRKREIPSPLDATYFNNQFYFGEEAIAKLFIKNGGLKNFNKLITKVKQIAKDFSQIEEMNLNSYLLKYDKITAKEWLQKNGFPEFYEARFNVASRGLFGANIDEISALSFFPEIAFEYCDAEPLSESDVKELALEKLAKGDEETATWSFEKGIAEIPLAISKYLGNRIQYNSTVVNISEGAKNYIIEYNFKENKKQTITADYVILATPAPVTLKIGESVLSSERKMLLKQIPYASYITVALKGDEPIWESSFDLGVPDGWFFTDVYDATWIERYYNPQKKNLKSYVATLYIATESYKNTNLLQLTDNEILQKCYTDLDKLIPKAKQKVKEVDIHKFPYAYPIMIPGAYKRLIRLNKLNEGAILLAGDYMLYPTFEAAAESGAMAAEILMEE